MFPYAAIIAANSKNKGYKPKAPKVETLKDYTETSTEDFYKKLVDKSEYVGILVMADMISNWMNFDNLTEKQKIRFVRETETPEYYSLENRFKRFFNIK